MSMYGKYAGKKGPLSVSEWPVTDCSKDFVLTIQADKDEVDINKIMKKIENGRMVNILQREPFYGDVSEFNGLQDAIMKVEKANGLFNDLPASVRERFANDPAEMIKFLEDDKNLDEAVELGICSPRPKTPVEPATIPPVTGGK